MAKIKSFTDIEQSRKLTEILPLESADMRYEYPSIEKDEIQKPMNGFHTSSFDWFKGIDSFKYIPCWSLSALLDVLPDAITNYDGIAFKLNIKKNIVEYSNPSLYLIYKSVKSDNLIDACYEMIIKLHELKML